MKNKKFSLKTILLLLAIILPVAIVFPIAIVLANKVPNPIYIRNEDEFYNINNKLDGYYILNDTITFTKPIKPIGDKNHPFTGRLDGGKSGASFNNIVFDLNEFNSDNYRVNNSLYVGLFPFNKGTIIHNYFNNISFTNFDYYGESDLVIGTICGLNEGKITSNRITNMRNLNFSSPKNITFGGLCGINNADIRRDEFIMHFNFKILCNELTVGEFAGKCGENSIIEMCKTSANLNIYEDESLKINTINCGVLCGSCTGGNFSNNYLFHSNIDLMLKKIDTFNCGGLVGYRSGNAGLTIKNCYVDMNIISNGTLSQKVSLGIGESASSNDSFQNLLIGRELSSHNTIDSSYFSDLTRNLNSTIENCFVINGTKMPKNSINCVDKKIKLSDVSLSIMHWSDAYWSIENGEITLKVFDIDE